MAHEHCHCRDYSRSQLLHAAAAQAGKGLPAIEGGMPAPAGTGLSRRSFLLRGSGLLLSIYGASKLPLSAFEEGIAHANPADKVLVSIFFDGGIDALNTMAPINSSYYQSKRPTLALQSGIQMRDPAPAWGSDELFWHPSAAALETLRQESKLTIFPAIGYDDPDQSHFTSRHFYEIGEVKVGANTGWLGRVVDQVGTDDNPLQGLSMSGELSPMLATASKPVAAVEAIDGYDLWSHAGSDPIEANMLETFANLGEVATPTIEVGMNQARRAAKQTSQVREELAGFGEITVPPSYPDTYLGRQLAGLAAIIASPLSVRLVTLSATGGYDTHSNQAQDLANNLKETADAVLAFQRDIEARGLADQVLINMWSEFGRRPEENGSGTDHGAAGLAFVVGKHAAPGIVGGFPTFNASALDEDDNLVHTSDFRGMYCSLLEQWLSIDPGGIIPGEDSFPRYTLVD
jgi:uncharacterized protein (DUF1501 family)